VKTGGRREGQDQETGALEMASDAKHGASARSSHCVLSVCSRHVTLVVGEIESRPCEEAAACDRQHVHSPKPQRDDAQVGRHHAHDEALQLVVQGVCRGGGLGSKRRVSAGGLVMLLILL
jgi:hypothetical protein